MTGSGTPNTPGGEQPPEFHFSYGKFVLAALGSGVLVLVVCVPIILALAHWSPIAGLIASAVSVIAMITVIGYVSRRQISRAEQAIRAAQQHPQP